VHGCATCARRPRRPAPSASGASRHGTRRLARAPRGGASWTARPWCARRAARCASASPRAAARACARRCGRASRGASRCHLDLRVPLTGPPPAVAHALRDPGFSDALPARLLLGTGGWLAPLREAAAEDGHDAAWLCPWPGGEPAACVPLGELDDVPAARAVVARDAAWAVVVTDDGDAVLAGPPELVEAVRRALPGDGARRLRDWWRWVELPLEALGLAPPEGGDPLAEAIGDEGALWLQVRPAHAGVVLSLARLGRPDRTFERDEGRAVDVDVRDLPAQAREALRGRRPWFQLLVVGPDVVVRVGEGWVHVRTEDLAVVPALRAAVAPARLEPGPQYAPAARAAMAARLASMG